MTNHAAQLAIIKHVTRQESRSSAGNCQADEQTLITQLSRPGSRDCAVSDHAKNQFLVSLLFSVVFLVSISALIIVASFILQTLGLFWSSFPSALHVLRLFETFLASWGRPFCYELSSTVENCFCCISQVLLGYTPISACVQAFTSLSLDLSFNPLQQHVV